MYVGDSGGTAAVSTCDSGTQIGNGPPMLASTSMQTQVLGTAESATQCEARLVVTSAASQTQVLQAVAASQTQAPMHPVVASTATATECVVSLEKQTQTCDGGLLAWPYVCSVAVAFLASGLMLVAAYKRRR
mmetsp:Transcript_85832/g.135541  ORF Transcript_85832/g.135541 Transcript_85832/m.135541 type:complete len:132 (-) Transcript_85832:94-489(-)